MWLSGPPVFAERSLQVGQLIKQFPNTFIQPYVSMHVFQKHYQEIRHEKLALTQLRKLACVLRHHSSRFCVSYNSQAKQWFVVRFTAKTWAHLGFNVVGNGSVQAHFPLCGLCLVTSRTCMISVLRHMLMSCMIGEGFQGLFAVGAFLEQPYGNKICHSRVSTFCRRLHPKSSAPYHEFPS